MRFVEQVYIELTKIGEIVSRATLVLPEGTWSVDERYNGFKRDMESFIQSYFGEDESPKDRVTDYQEILDMMERYLKDLKKRC